MTFTPNPPTMPGYFLWRLCSIDAPTLCWVLPHNDGSLWMNYREPATRGEWCRLVPAEEVEKAWEEGARGLLLEDHWIASRAKRVMEGKQ